MGESIEISMDNGDGMTLAELSTFVERCGTRGIDPTTLVTCRVTFGGRLKSLTAKRELD